MLTLYKNIRELRKQNGWSQEELAKRMGYTDRSSIAKIESGKVDLSQSKIMDFARIFDVDAGILMGNDGIVLVEQESPEESLRAKRIIEYYKALTPDAQDAVEKLLQSYPKKQ